MCECWLSIDSNYWRNPGGRLGDSSPTRGKGPQLCELKCRSEAILSALPLHYLETPKIFLAPSAQNKTGTFPRYLQGEQGRKHFPTWDLKKMTSLRCFPTKYLKISLAPSALAIYRTTLKISIKRREKRKTVVCTFRALKNGR